MTNKERLINEVLFEAKNCYKKGISTNTEELRSAISEVIGDSVIGDNETLIEGKVTVDEEVNIQGNTMLCRKLKITFYTREFRISSCNFLVPMSDFFDEGTARKSAPAVYEYNGPLENQPEMMILHGDKKYDVPDNLEYGYSKFDMRIASIEKQDVFVVTKHYVPGNPVKKSLQTPDSHYTGHSHNPTYFYESDSLRVPKTIYQDTYWYFPAEKVRTWFGFSSKKKRIDGSDPVIGKSYIKVQKRDNFKYSVDFYLSEEVNAFIDNNSVSFDPLHLEKLASC